MTRIKCTACGTKYFDNKQTCPSCDYPTWQSEREQNLEKNLYKENEKETFNISTSEVNTDNQVNEPHKHNNNNRNKRKIKSPFPNLKSSILILLYSLVLLGVIMYINYNDISLSSNYKSSIFQNKEAIEIVKNSIPDGYNMKVGKEIEEFVEEEYLIRNIYGWKAYSIKDDICFVQYGFDYDSIEDNGYNKFCFQVDLATNKVENINIDKELRGMYRDLGYY